MWVLVEHREGEIEEASLEVVSEARRLAKAAKLNVSALVLGTSGTSLADALTQQGADIVYFAEHPLLKTYTTEGYTAALVEVLRSHKPQFLLMAATVLGRDLAPRLAARFNTGVVSDCTVLNINDQGALEMSRPSLGGRVYTTFVCPSARPQIATVRPGVLGIGKPIRGKPSRIETLQVELRPEMVRTRTLGVSKVERSDLDISEAEVVLAFGRGLADSAMLGKVEELAQLLQASVGGSRAAVDERWIPFSRQIGQTGKTIAPKVIVCCGISGAQQFTMGMRDARFIVAINSDRNAPIFKVADVPVLADMHEIIPELIQRFRMAAEASS